MLFDFNLKRCFAVALLTIMLSVISVAGVAEPGRRAGYIDSRYHHN
jgi:hypothetical protein